MIGDPSRDHEGRPLSRDASFLRRKAVGEKWVRFCAEVPPELATALDAAQRKSLGINWTQASRANLVRAGLRLYLEHADPEGAAAVDVHWADVEEVDVQPVAELESGD